MTISITVTGEDMPAILVQLATFVQGVPAAEAPQPKATAPKPKAEAPKADPTPPTETVSASTPAPAKDEGNSQGLSTEDFCKMGLQFAKHCGDNGARMKAIWAELDLRRADGEPVERLGAIQEKDYDRFLAATEEAKLA